MSEQSKRAQRREQEDAAFNRMLIWLAGCAGLEAVTLLLRRLYLHWTNATVQFVYGMSEFFLVFRFVGLALSVAGLVWVIAAVRKKAQGKQLILPLTCTGAVVWLTIAAILCADVTFCREMGMTLLCALPVVIAALAIVFFLYQREFFYCSVLSAMGIVAIWVYRSIYNNHPTMTRLGFALVWAVLALAAAAAIAAKKGDGKLFGLQVLPTATNCMSIWITCAAAAALMAVTMLVGVGYAFYVMFALIGWLFCLAVYYTVKLM